MKPLLYSGMAVLMLLGSARAQLRPEKFKPLEASDPASATADVWQAELEKHYSKEGLIAANFHGRWVHQSEALKAMFPDYRFIAIQWSEKPAPGKEGQALGLGFGLEVTLVCNTAGKQVKEVLHHGNYEAFGEMLRDKKVSLRGPEDAKRIWKAFCDLHQKHWEDQASLKIDEKTWHLGTKTIERFHYFYEVKLDAEGLVTGAELKAKAVADEK